MFVIIIITVRTLVVPSLDILLVIFLSDYQLGIFGLDIRKIDMIWDWEWGL